MWCSTMTCVGPAATLSASTAATRIAIAASSTGVRRRTASAKPANAAATSLASVAGVPGKPDGDQEPGHGGARGGGDGQRLRCGAEANGRSAATTSAASGNEMRARPTICPHVRGSGRCGASRLAAARQATAARRGRRAPHPPSRRAASGDSPVGVDPVGARAVARRHRLEQGRALEMERAVVVGGDAGRKDALRDEAAVDRPAARLAVEVRAHAPREQAESVGEPVDASIGVGDPALEPAQRPGRHAGHHHARLPGLAQDRVDAVRAPDREHVDGVPAADVDDVLGEQVGAHVAPVAREERQVGRARTLRRERGVEADDVRSRSRPTRSGRSRPPAARRRSARARRRRARRRHPPRRTPRRPGQRCS